MHIHLWLCLMILCLSIASSQGYIQNGSFEQDLQDWEMAGPDGSISAQDVFYFKSELRFDPIAGSKLGLLKSGNYTTNHVEIKQNIVVNPGDKIEGWFFFGTDDWLPYNDTATISLRRKDADEQDANNILLVYVDVNDVNSYRCMSNWEQFSFVFGKDQAGEWELTCEVTDALDSILTSYLGVDELSIINAPPAVPTLGADRPWIYLNDANQVCNKITVFVEDINDPVHNSDYIFRWEPIMDPNIGLALRVVESDPNTGYAVFAAPYDANSVARSYPVMCTVIGKDFGNSGSAVIDINCVEQLKGDLDLNGLVDFRDYSIFAAQLENGYCDECTPANLDHNAVLDMTDLEIFCRHWLESAEVPGQNQ